MSQYTPMQKRQPGPAGQTGVYASLDELMRLRYRASGFSFLPRQPIHSILSGRHASRLRGRGLNFEELRNYLPGDDVRNIDWKVTARTREPYIRVYTEEKDRTVWLLIDQRLSMFFGSKKKMKSVVAAEATALAAWRVLSQGDRVGAIIFDDTELDVIPPHRSEERVAQILKRLVKKNHALNAGVDTEPGPHMLNRALKRVAALARHDCLVCLIGDGTGIDRDTQKYVTRLTEHNDVISVFVYDPLEQAMPEAGRLFFSDGISELEFNTQRRSLRQSYSDDFQKRTERMEATSRRHAIPLLPVHTAAPVLEQVREVLGRHGR
ncbi:MAG: DUF58 domain-containing protein [Xanthomonadales bacterium]|nr:DUF58 domain-containing protein [Gammaproteobacteria bacterium]MBT8052564.1 DUF58 domain-containing protein [Gammaproteobacteria bacterium]NND57755.1 DUF58 domain-containing protein [Xanthomonadales bacterium]NNK51470.1 DUF58 domain-containing protein [Xanthomonadales bacterium]